MQVNRVKGVVERYVGEIAGTDKWETIYDPRSDGVSQLEFLIAEIRNEEREKFAAKLAELSRRI